MEPKKLKKVILKEELFALTGDTFEAIILSQLIYWQERVSDFDKFIKEERERAECHNIPFKIEETNGWIYKKASELKDECMLTVSEQTIRKHLQSLIKKGFISYRQNPSYKWDKTLQYRVNIKDVIDNIKRLGYEGLSDWRYVILSNLENGDSYLENGDSYLENGGAIPDTTYINYNTETKEEKEDTNVSSKVEEDWRTSFAIYKALVEEGVLKLKEDNKNREYIEKFYRNADYDKSIDKMVEGFWGTEDGWQYCKKHRKSKSINMYSALKKNMDDRRKIVYKTISTMPSKESYQPKTTVPLHPSLIVLDKEGNLNDGTYTKNGFRYYFSEKNGLAVSVPPGAEPKPNGSCWEYDYVDEEWYKYED